MGHKTLGRETNADKFPFNMSIRFVWLVWFIGSGKGKGDSTRGVGCLKFATLFSSAPSLRLLYGEDVELS